ILSLHATATFYNAINFLFFCLGEISKINISCPDGLKFIQKGEDISLYCSFSHYDTSVISWFKQIPGEKALLIASSSNSAPTYHNNFDKSGRFNALKERGSFTLNIRHAEASDSATYFCAAAYYTAIALSDYTPSSLYTVLQPPVSDPVQLGGDTTLQCSILTDNSAGDHSVYWFRHGSGESDPGIIFTHGNRSDQCKNSSETVSPTQSCIYKLPKNKLSLSDAGTYYCAVAACGEIIFGKGTKLDFTGGKIHLLSPSQCNRIILEYLIVPLTMFNMLHVFCCGVGQTEETGDVNYAALSFNQPRSSRRSRTKNSDDQSVYSHVKIRQ
uniref:Ig-like domain-containing protein n=1 Tax=Astyanax mexicanus TaxID=7994 RepID=A0A3B1IN60_ASTMX